MKKKHGLIVIGGSSGGLQAVMQILSGLTDTFEIPIVIVLHQLKNSGGRLKAILQTKTKIPVSEPLDKEKIEHGHIYVAPSDYHLMVESDESFSYSYSEAINYSRPSIDVLFETAGSAYKDKLVGVLLTGANDDGAQGIRFIGIKGAYTIVEDPASAEMPVMPQSAIAIYKPDKILSLKNISNQLNQLDNLYETTQRFH